MRLATRSAPLERASARTARLALILAAATVLASCVTVNVYFPAAAAQKAADKIIRAVTGGNGGAAAQPASPPSTPAAAPPTAATVRGPQGGSILEALAGRVVMALVPVAHAAGQADLDISTPQIRAIIAAMHQRFAQLKPYFRNGVIGMTTEGVIAIRDQSSVPLMQRAQLAHWVAQQNHDLSQLYTQIADANGHPAWAGNIRSTFASRWIAHAKQNGWYNRDSNGSWIKG